MRASTICRLLSTNPGFTLIEMMVATSVLVLVVIASYNTYRAGIGAWQRGEEGIDSLYGARLVQEMIVRDLRGAFLPPLDLSDPSNPKSPKITFIGRPTEMEFVTSSNSPNLLSEAKESDLIRVRYSFSQGELKRDSGESGITLATGMKEITFSYHNGRTWQEFWDQDEILPKGVRIEIELDDGRRLPTTVWIPSSQLVSG